MAEKKRKKHNFMPNEIKFPRKQKKRKGKNHAGDL